MRGIVVNGSYNMGLWGNIVDAEPKGTPQLALAESELPEAAELTNGFTLKVAEGTPALMSGAGNWQEGPMPGLSFKLFRPDGTQVIGSTAADASGEMLLPAADSNEEGALCCAIIVDPMPGEWTVQWVAANDNENCELTFGAMPLEDAAQTMANETAAVLQQASGNHATRSNWACKGCHVAAYALALAITAVAAGVGVATLTAEAAIVVATAGFLGVTAPVALGLIAGLSTAATVAVSFVLTQLCSWAHIC